MLAADPALAPARTFSLPRPPAGDSASARLAAEALRTCAAEVGAVQRDAHRLLDDAHTVWTGRSATASNHPLAELDRRTASTQRALLQAADALEHYAHQLDAAHRQHHWSWTKVLTVAAVVAVTTAVVVVTVGAAAPEAAAADAALVEGEVAATTAAAGAAAAAGADAADSLLLAGRALQALRAGAAFLKPQIAVTAGLTDVQAFEQVRTTGHLDLGALARQAGTGVAFGSIGGELAGAVGTLGADAANPVARWLLPKLAVSGAWSTTTAGEELLLDGRVDGSRVLASGGLAFAGTLVGEATRRWVSPATPGRVVDSSSSKLVVRRVRWRDTPNQPDWGFTAAHVTKHFLGDNPRFSLKLIDPGGTVERWLDQLEELTQRPATTIHADGMVQVEGYFPRADGSGTFRLGIRLHPNAEGGFDFVTLLTRQ